MFTVFFLWIILKYDMIKKNYIKHFKKDYIMNKFAERLKSLREEKGLSQRALSRETGFSQAGIARWESNSQVPTIDTAITLAKYFGVTTDYIIGVSDSFIPKVHTLNLKPIYFDLIQKGEKILEGRLNDDKRKDFKIGDLIVFFKEPEKKETIKALITARYEFNDFEEMANNLDKSLLGFTESTTEEMVNVYRTIYSRQDELKYGVVVFGIEPV